MAPPSSIGEIVPVIAGATQAWAGLFARFAGLLLALPVLAFLGRRPPPPPEDTERIRSLARQSELEQKLQRLRMVIRKTSALNATLNYERVMDMVLDLSASAVANGNPDDARLVSSLLLYGGDRLCVESARGFTHADMRVELYGNRGVIGEALAAGHLITSDDPAHDAELQFFAALHPCQSAVIIPLVVGLEAYGLLLFAHPNPGYFDGERLELLEAIAQQAMFALQNAKLYRDLEEEKEHLGEAEEEARQKLARDLHDGPTQSISAIAMRVNFARRLMERDPKAAADELYKIEELARRTTKEIRQMLFTLRPLVLESEGLVPALRHLANKVHETHGQEVIVEAQPGVADDLEVGKQGVVFYIAEEAITNARKHAQADHIWVRLKRKGDLLTLEVQDDGVGFDVAEVTANYEQRGSLGMLNLHERTELVNGVLRLDSAKGRGTRVAVTIPMTGEAAERIHGPGFTG
jgi:signal transduction histidine kinase